MELIQKLANRFPLEKYWKKKFKLSDQLWQIVNWEGLEQAYGKSNETHCQWATKYTSGFLAMVRICSFSQCLYVPNAGKQSRMNSTSLNVNMSLHPRNGIWQLQCLKFRETGAAHEIANAILSGLAQWQGGDPALDQLGLWRSSRSRGFRLG